MLFYQAEFVGAASDTCHFCVPLNGSWQELMTGMKPAARREGGPWRPLTSRKAQNRLLT